MWTADQREQFERTGILCVRQAFPRDAADAMLDAVWRYLERTSALRRADNTTWALPRTSLKRLKRNRVFSALVDNPSVPDALDGIFGTGAWVPSKQGAQILTTFPSEPPWTLPHQLWHTDTGFERPPWPAFAVKLFACVHELRPGGGATLALAGSHRLVDRFRPMLEDLGGCTTTWRQFMRQDPWLDALQRPGIEPARTQRLLGARHNADGEPIEIVEMTGDPGDVFITHLQVFHCTSPNVNPTPRITIANGVAARRVGEGEVA